MPKITIIIALNNTENIANLCLESLTLQSFSDYECLCVKQNQEEEYSFLTTLIKKDSRFKLIKTQNGTPTKYDCYNDALYHVKGKYVLFLNDTDLLHIQALDIFVDALRYTHSKIATSNPFYFSTSKIVKKQKQPILFDKSVLKKKSQNLLSDFWQENPFQIDGKLEGKAFDAETISFLKFHTNLKEFAPYFFMEQFYSLIKDNVYIKYPLYLCRKEAHIPSISSFETLNNLKERIVFEYAYFIESGRVNGYNAIVLKRKCSQDFFNALKHVVLHTPESTMICINQQLINLILDVKQYDMLQGLSLSLFQKLIILALVKNKLSLAKRVLKFLF
ncbi:MAG: glycosyltransferase family 2 protein [Alphaproteobacteria bacterium]|nr:glycosyltransferase family 2 protein [Alphaproteobacteria bacterium]